MKFHPRRAATALYAVRSAVSSVRCRRVAAVLAVLLVGGLFSTESFAATVPLASYTVYAEGSSTPSEINVAGTLTNSACNGSLGCENSFGSASAGLAVSTNGSTSGVNPANAGGQGSIAFYYEIIGPAGNVSVPLIISGSASTSASGADATAEAYIEYGAGDLYTCSSTVAGPCGSEAASGSLNSVRFTNQFSNTLYDLEVIATGDSTLGTGAFSAKISGLSLGIDPTWMASNPGYSLVPSSNVTLAPTPVPIPTAAWLFGSGLLGLLVVARRQKPSA